jgi:hypothetical protein
MTIRIQTEQGMGCVGTTLESVYTPFRDKMAEYRRVAERDGRKAEKVFAEAQEIAKAFWAGAEYVRGATPR